MIIVRLAGGLGNQLFQYAFGRALAHRHNVPLKLDTHLLTGPLYRNTMTERAYSLGLFAMPVSLASPAEVAPYVPFVDQQPDSRVGWYAQRIIRKASQAVNSRYILEKDADAFDATVLTRAPATGYLAGYWQSERYFTSVQEILRSELCFAAPLQGRAAALASEMQAIESVCVHVRRTDFLTDSQQTTLTPDQIRLGVQELLRRGMKPALFVFSDDIDWCSQQVKVPHVPVHYITDEEIGPDVSTHIQLMSHCRHFILSVSTFGWWAAWLARHPRQLVLYPRHPRSSMWAAPGWIQLPATKSPHPFPVSQYD